MVSFAINQSILCNDRKEYILKKELRSGGQGETYIVEAADGSGEYVFKILRDKNQQRLNRKIENIRTLKNDSPNLLRQLRSREFSVALPLSLYDKRDAFGYVMQRCSGREINDLMIERQFDCMPLRERVMIVQRIAQAVEWFRKSGYCYQDISHKNVMYDAQTKQVSIIDCDNVAPERTAKLTKIVGGTSFFVAPEIAFQNCGHSINTDQYSLAVLLFKIMTGSTDSPYHGRRLYSKQPKPVDMFSAADYYAEDPSYGTDWLTFIFDPQNPINRLDLDIFRNPADRARHRRVQDNWATVPENMKALFYRAFIDPLNEEARKKRPNAGEWIDAVNLPEKPKAPPAPAPPPKVTATPTPKVPQNLLCIDLYSDATTYQTIEIADYYAVRMPSGKSFGKIEKKEDTFLFTSECLYAIRFYAKDESGTLARGDSVALTSGMQLYIPQRPNAKIVVK